MSKNERYARVIVKRTNIPNLSATTAPSDDHTLLPAWNPTDIYKGEFFMNLPDEKLWIRTENDIREVCLSPCSGGSGGTSDDHFVVNGYYDSDTNSLYLNRQDAQVIITGFTSGSGSDTLSGLTDTTITDATYLDFLVWSGDTWINTQGVIGNPEDGTYTDGLFTDFTPETTIGLVTDRFNEVLKSLAPPPAPTLSSTSTILNGTKQTSNGKISFGTDNTIISYYDGGYIVGVSKVLSLGNGTETGVLADNVPAHSTSYDSNAFTSTGVIIVKSIYDSTTLSNSVDLDSIPNTSYSNTTNGITINLSEVKYSEFPSGDPFTNFEYRTGTWSISSSNFDNGINKIEVEYESSLIGDDEFAVDKDATNTTVTTPLLNTLSMSGSKYLSGVEYYTSGTAKYSCILSNVYKNTWYNNGNISYSTTNVSVSSDNIGDVSGVGADDVDITISNKTATINVDRLLNSSIGVGINRVERTLVHDDTPTNTIQYINNILMDNVSDNSINTLEYFNGEDYRLKDVIYSVTANITNSANIWDSEDDLNVVSGLQVYGGNLVYPSINFSSISNGPAGNPNYVGISGQQTYVRKYNLGLGVSNLVINIAGSGSGTFKATDDSSGDYIHVEAKSGVDPGPSLTSWLDCYRTVANGGCYAGTYGSNQNFNGNWGITFGTNGSAYSDGYVLLRITTNANITSSQISLTSFS